MNAVRPEQPSTMASVARGHFMNALFLVCSLFGLGWSTGALAQVADVYTLTTVPPTSLTVLPGGGATLTATYLKNGIDPGNISTDWNASPAGGFFTISNSVSTDGSTGAVTNTFISYSPGTYTITVDGNPNQCASSCPPQISYTVTVEAPVVTAVTPASGAITIPQNSSTTLKVQYAGPTLPIADGTNIDWDVFSEPALGAGAFSPQDGGPPSYVRTTTLGGFTQVDLGVTIAGTYTVRARYCPDGCNPADTVTFTITVVTTPAMTVTKALASNADGDNSGTITQGDVLTYTVTAHNSGDVSLNNVQVTDPLLTPTSNTCATLAINVDCVLTGTYTVTLADVTAGSISNTGHAQSTELPSGVDSNTLVTPVLGSPLLTLTNVLSGNADGDNSGTITQGDVLTFTITAHNSGNIVLNNVLVSDATITPNTITCINLAVAADCVLIGTYTVTAADANAGSISNIGSAQAAQVTTAVVATVVTTVVATVRTLQIVSGNGQVGTPGAALPNDFVVQAFDNGIAAPGIGINWVVTAGSGSISPASSSTDAAGKTSSLLTLGASPGEVTVTARRADDASVIVTFSANAALLGDLSGLNPKQKALADAIDKFCFELPSSSSDSGVNDLRQRCEELIGSIYSDPSGVLDALDQLFPDIGLVMSESSLLAAESQFENIKVRIAALRSGTQGTSFGGLALNTGRGALPIGLAFQTLLDGDSPGGEVGSAFSRWGFFAAGSIGRGNANPGQINPGYNYDINGLTFGADYRKSDKFILGGTVGYTRQSNDLVGGRGKLDTSGYSISAFSTYYQNNSWYLDDVLSVGHNSYDMVRNVHYTIIPPGGTATHIDQTSHGSSNGNSFTFAASVGRDFNRGGLSFGPFLRTIYSRLKFDPLTETFEPGKAGSGLGMVIDTHDVTSLSSTLGAKLTFTHSASWGVLIPHLQAEWQHEFKSDPASVTAYFLNDPSATPFSVTGDPIDTDFFRLGVGLSFVLTHGRSGFFYYEKLLSRDRITQDSLAFGLRVEF